MTTITYTLSQFTNGLNVAKLKREVAATPGLESVVNVAVDGTTVDIIFTNAIDSAGQAALDAVVAAHVGTPDYTAVLLASASIASNAVSVTEDAAWQILGGAYSRPDAFLHSLPLGLGQIIGEAKVSGTGAQIRQIEKDPVNGDVEQITPQTLADTAGEWVPFNFLTTVPARAGFHTYEVQARLNGATTLELRYVTMALLELR